MQPARKLVADLQRCRGASTLCPAQSASQPADGTDAFGHSSSAALWSKREYILSLDPYYANIFIDSCAFDPKYEPESSCSEEIFQMYMTK